MLSDVARFVQFETRDLLEQLPADDQRVLVDYYVRGETLEAMGAASGRDASTVMRRIRRALSKLRALAQ